MHPKSVLLVCLSLCLILASARRLGVLPDRFVGKGAYMLAAKRHTMPYQPHQQQQKQQQEFLQQQQQQQQQQRRQLFQWATMRKKLA